MWITDVLPVVNGSTLARYTTGWALRVADQLAHGAHDRFRRGRRIVQRRGDAGRPSLQPQSKHRRTRGVHEIVGDGSRGTADLKVRINHQPYLRVAQAPHHLIRYGEG